ncbi:MAG TPA: AAA family ATPase [Polyangiaceae bacterium]|jgi:serine/threonine protein kinase/predicted ATPase
MHQHEPPSVIASRYRVLEEIGRGNVGRVFRVEHLHTGEMLALKLLFAKAEADPGLVERFKREARAPALIKSENVVRITDADVAPELGGAPFFVMELLEGTDLEQYVVQRGKLDADEVVGILGQAARALDKAHAIGIVHRDLKPGNIFLHSHEDGLAVKVLDFGISKIGGLDGPGQMQIAEITATGTIMGTPLYMPPEQALARAEILPSADIWAIGMIAFRLLTGTSYWSCSTMAELMIAIVRDPLSTPSARVPSLTPAFDAWFARSCNRDAAARWPSVSKQILALAEALGVPPPELSTQRSPLLRAGLEGTQASAGMRPLVRPPPVTGPGTPFGKITAHERRTPAMIGGSDQVPASTDGERRQVTVLSCEAVVTPTRPGEEIDPEDLTEIMRDYHAACASVFGGLGGPVSQTMGDGLLVYFGYPIAHGDDAKRAVTAGLRIVDAVALIDQRAAKDFAAHIMVRVGIHTGVVVVAEKAGVGDPRNIVGQAPSTAFQIKRGAPAGAVIVSGSTYKLVKGRFHFEVYAPAGTAEGRPELETIYLVRRDGGDLGDDTLQEPATPLVGRDTELSLLLDCWEQLKGGEGHVVLLMGEAGIGKSRILKAFKNGVRGQSVSWLEARCSPFFQSTALAPVVDLLARIFRIEPSDSLERKAMKLEEGLRGRILPADALPLLGSLLGVPPPPGAAPLNLSPQRQRQRTHEAILALLLAMSAQEPVVFVVDDLHWVDPSTLELLGLLIDHGPATGLVCVLTARPDFTPPWTARSHTTQVSLGRLPRPRIEKLVTELAGGKPMPKEVVDQLVTKTDGVPLFVEELTKMVIESSLVKDAGDRWVLAAPLPALAIPATLRDSLTARLDRLGDVKATAQLASAIGREFSFELLQAVSPLGEKVLEDQLHKLVECELIYQRRLPPRRTFLFKHQLVQEAAYESLLKNVRKQYHQRIADVLVRRFPDVADGQPEVLAFHHAAGGQPMQAVEFLMRAGQKALERSANVEAIAHLTRALDLVAALPETPERASVEAAVRTILGVPLMMTKGYGAPEVEQAFARARELKKTGGARELLPVLWGLWIFYHVRAKYRTALELTDQLLDIADRGHDSDARLCAHLARGCTSVLLGEFEGAKDHLERAIALYDPALHRAHAHMFGQDPGMFARVMLGWALWPMGRADQASQLAEEGVILARGLSHPNTLGFALGLAGAIDQNRGDEPMTDRRGGELVALSKEQGLVHWLGLGQILHGWARKERGEAAGLDEMQAGRGLWRMIGARVADSHWDCIVAESLAQAGRHQEATDILEGTLAFIAESDERFYEPEVHRLLGEIALASGAGEAGTASAEGYFQRAQQVARSLRAPAHELRVATSLFELRRRQGKQEEGRALLAEAVAKLKEGQGTRDVRRAKALLAGEG